MKKNIIYSFLTALFFMSSFVVFAQVKTQITSNETGIEEYGNAVKSTNSLIFSEDFSGGTFPPLGWSKVGSGQANWKSSTSTFAGGAAPEALFASEPTFSGNSKLVTPKISTSGKDSLVLQFNHFVHNYSSGYTVLVETTSNGVTWNTVWSANITGSINPETVFVPIKNSDVGSNNFQIAFTFSGSSSHIFSWYIDNIMLNESLAYDAEATQIWVPSTAGDNGTIAPVGMVTNKGSKTITFDATVEILDATSTIVYSQVTTVTDLPSYESKVLTFPGWPATAGNYTVKLKSSMASDQNLNNNLVSSSMQIVAGVIFKKPLYEEFTSSTCAPCSLQNPVLDAVLAANPISHSLIKYQVNWPGSGDPYYTAECGVRSNFYANSTAPKVYINSTSQWVGGMTQAIYDSYIGLPAKMDIDIVNAYIDTNMNVTIGVNINVLENFAAGLTAHIAIVEKTTVNNATSNGETEFNNVMMKMLPNASGTTLAALSPGNSASISESYNMNTTHMEDPTDLAVIVFVQNGANKTVLQSEMMDIPLITGIAPPPLPVAVTNIAPANGATNINNGSSLSWEFGANTDQYQLMLGTSSTPTTAVVAFTSTLATSYTLVGLTPNTTYYWQVKAKNTSGTTPGPIWSFTTTPLPLPVAVTNIAPPNNAINIENGISLSWEFGANTEQYQLMLGTSSTPTTAVVAFTSTLATAYTLVNLIPNTTYYWQVNAKNSSGTTPGPIWSFTTTPLPLPVAVTNIAPANGATNINTGSLLSWQFGANTEEYQLMLGTSSTPTNAVVAFTNNLATAYILSDLLPNTTYYWQVNAKNSTGTTPGPIWSFTTAALLLPVAVTNIAPTNGATNINNGSSLSWAFGANTNEYQVMIGTSAIPTNVVVDYTTILVNSYTLSNLEPNTTYYWQVNAKNSVGIAPGPIWSFTTTPPPLPVAVTNIAPANGATFITINGSELSWAFGANTDEYQLMFGTNSNPTTVVVDFTNNLVTSYALAGLQYNTTYYWQVNAKNTAGITAGPIWSFNTVLTGINNPDDAEVLQVYASGDLLYLKTTSNEVALVKVYDLAGQLVLQGKTGGNTLSTFNTASLSKGIYLVNVLLNNRVVSRKVPIQK